MTNSYYNALLMAEKSVADSVPEFDDEPVSFSKEHESAMKLLFEKMSGKKRHNSIKTALKVFAVAAVILSLTVTVIGFPRTKAYEVTDFGVYSEYKVVAETKDIPVEEMEIGYMPDDFKKVNEIVSDYMKLYVFEYNGNQITLYKGSINYPVKFDSEKNSIDTVSADGIKFMSYYKGNYNGFIWNDGKYIYTVKSTVDKDETFEIARHLK